LGSGIAVVVYNDEIHILRGTNHYKWDGDTWTQASVIPYSFTGYAVVYGGEIHILGGYNSSSHYKWDGDTWTQAPVIPYSFYEGCAVVYGGEIHILGSDKKPENHYKTYQNPSSSNVIGDKVVIYQNSSNMNGIYATNFISGINISSENNKFPSGFDDIFYIDESGNVEESPTYYGDGTQWIKFKN